MRASRHVIFFFAFIVVLVSAIPLHHRRRRTQCGGVTSLAMSGTSTATTTTESASRSGSPSSSYSSKPGSPREAKADTKSSSSNLVGNLLEQLLPVAESMISWTTSPSPEALPLDDATFRPHNEIKSLSHNYVNAPDGKKSMQAHYPKDSYDFQNKPGGFSFYAPGPLHVDLTTAKEALFGYSVFFPSDFDFVKGGKLPGIYGGDSDEEAVSCSGGRRDNGCFSARLMWRSQGDGELYTYLPPSFDENKAVCNVPPESICNSQYGASVGRKSFKFAKGKRTNISERVRLNDAGKANGEIELFVDGKSVVNVQGLVLRDSGAGRMRGLQMQTFFGGSTTDYATPKAQDVYFADFSVSIIEYL